MSKMLRSFKKMVPSISKMVLPRDLLQFQWQPSHMSGKIFPSPKTQANSQSIAKRHHQKDGSPPIVPCKAAAASSSKDTSKLERHSEPPPMVLPAISKCSTIPNESIFVNCSWDVSNIIYEVVTSDGFVYVGKTTQTLQRRIYAHFAEKDCTLSTHIRNNMATLKTVTVLHQVEAEDPESALNEAEKFYIGLAMLEYGEKCLNRQHRRVFDRKPEIGEDKSSCAEVFVDDNSSRSQQTLGTVITEVRRLISDSYAL